MAPAQQPPTDDLFTQNPPAAQGDPRPPRAEPPGPHEDVRTPSSAPSYPPGVPAAPPRRPGWAIAWMILLVASLGLASGATGALLFARWRPPAPPVKVGTLSLTRLTRALAATDPAGFAARFDGAVAQLAEAEPGLVLFVKEAVIDTGQIADYTEALLPLLTRTSPGSAGSPPAVAPSLPPGAGSPGPAHSTP